MHYYSKMHKKCITRHVEEVSMVGKWIKNHKACSNKTTRVERRNLNDDKNKLKNKFLTNECTFVCLKLWWCLIIEERTAKILFFALFLCTPLNASAGNRMQSMKIQIFVKEEHC